MFRNILLSSVLLGWVTFATAAPITFTDPNYSVNATVSVDESKDVGSDSSTSTAIPLNVAKSVLTDSGSALASAFANVGNLSAATKVISSGGDAIASSNSSFSGIIDSLLGGSYQLAFNFTTSDPVVGPDFFADSKLAITIVSGLNTLYDKEFLSNFSLTDFTFSLAPDTTALFDVTLISTASATSGNASNTANVDFAINAGVNGVPEPHEGMLLLLGGLALVSIVWRGQPRKGSSLA